MNNHQYNSSIITSRPPGDFEKIGDHMNDWEAKFLKLAQQGKAIEYEVYEMPIIPEHIDLELAKMKYHDFILGSDQHFLVSKNNSDL